MDSDDNSSCIYRADVLIEILSQVDHASMKALALVNVQLAMITWKLYQSPVYWTAKIKQQYGIYALAPGINPRLLYEAEEFIAPFPGGVPLSKTFRCWLLFIAKIANYYSTADIMQLIQYTLYSNIISPLYMNVQWQTPDGIKQLRGSQIRSIIQRPELFQSIVLTYKIFLGDILIMLIRQMIRRYDYTLMFETLALMPKIMSHDIDSDSNSEDSELDAKETLVASILVATYSYIVSMGNINILERMLDEYPPSGEYNIDDAIMIAIKCRRLDIIKLIHSHKYRITLSSSVKFLGEAAKSGQFNIFEYYYKITIGADCVIDEAIESGNLDIVKMILAREM
jgi:hypothetical protein